MFTCEWVAFVTSVPRSDNLVLSSFSSYQSRASDCHKNSEIAEKRLVLFFGLAGFFPIDNQKLKGTIRPSNGTFGVLSGSLFTLINVLHLYEICCREFNQRI